MNEQHKRYHDHLYGPNGYYARQYAHLRPTLDSQEPPVPSDRPARRVLIAPPYSGRGPPPPLIDAPPDHNFQLPPRYGDRFDGDRAEATDEELAAEGLYRIPDWLARLWDCPRRPFRYGPGPGVPGDGVW